MNSEGEGKQQEGRRCGAAKEVRRCGRKPMLGKTLTTISSPPSSGCPISKFVGERDADAAQAIGHARRLKSSQAEQTITA